MTTQRVVQSHRGSRFGLILIVAFLVVSGILLTRPVMRLRPEPPSDFFEESRQKDAKHRAAEERVAKAYWNCALQVVQGKYLYGEVLPESPLSDFNIKGKEFKHDSIEAGSATRAHYWQKFRQAWSERESWQESRELNIDLVHDNLIAIQQASIRFADNLLHTFKL
jgi:hypothetical protein